MGMGGNGNELSGAIREWEWFFKCANFGNDSGKDLAGMGGIGNTENHPAHLYSILVSFHLVHPRSMTRLRVAKKL